MPKRLGAYASVCTDDSPAGERFSYGALLPGYLKWGFGLYPWRMFNTTQLFNPVDPLPTDLTRLPNPFDPVSVGTTSKAGAGNPTALPGPGNPMDVGRATMQDWLAYMEYSSQDLTIGVGGTYLFSFLGPELVPGNPVTPAVPDPLFNRKSTPSTETSLTEGWTFLQFHNGWVHLNAEADWYDRAVSYQPSLNGLFQTAQLAAPLPTFLPDGSGRSVFAAQHVDSWRFCVEGGVNLCVWPITLDFFYAYMPGPDRRHGILIDRQPFIRSPVQAAASLFAPYSLLLTPRYGGGFNCPGDLGGASTYAMRLQYPLAANLVLEGTALHARRNSKGYGWGFIQPLSDNVMSYNIENANSTSFTQPSPAIPEDSLGWEFTTGMAWQLSTNFTVETRAAYWQPGKWFNYACIDRSVNNWDIPTAANNWGINPNRTIDPVAGFQIVFTSSF